MFYIPRLHLTVLHRFHTFAHIYIQRWRIELKSQTVSDDFVGVFFFKQIFIMKSLAVQFLASIIVFISLSFSKEDGEGRDHPTYVVFDKKISIKEIIRFGGIKDESHGEMEAPHEKKNLGYLTVSAAGERFRSCYLGRW